MMMEGKTRSILFDTIIIPGNLWGEKATRRQVIKHEGVVQVGALREAEGVCQQWRPLRKKDKHTYS